MSDRRVTDLLRNVQWEGVLIVIQKVQPDGTMGEPYMLKAPAEKLDAALEKAAREFFDPTQPPTPPFPDHLLSASNSPAGRFPQTAPTHIGRRKRGR